MTRKVDSRAFASRFDLFEHRFSFATLVLEFSVLQMEVYEMGARGNPKISEE